jgi:dihydrodipicolinate synthase/N-acetylneuraminate lyase
MKTTPVTLEDLRGVFPVPPLARKTDAKRALDFEQNKLILRHMVNGGMTRFLYGGNAFLYHLTVAEYEQLLDWMTGFADNLWAIPSIGPSYGRAMDQAAILKRYNFPAVMHLPCGDPRDAKGLEIGLREISNAASTPLILYLKEENNFGSDKEAGLDTVAKLVDEGICVSIKYAVVRQDPTEDAYLASLLTRVDKARIVSGIGERPAVIHMRDWGLPGFTTGSGCIAPVPSNKLFAANVAQDYETAEALRTHFIPLEDLRDAISPAKVLHHATAAAGIAETGALPPFLSALSLEQVSAIAPVARELVERNRT